MFDLAAFAPDAWEFAEEYEPNADLRLDGNFLSEDFCVIEGRYFFVRCVLDIPVHGIAEKFGFGCWGTLSRGNFDIFLIGFNTGEYEDLGPWNSWLGNKVGDYVETLPLACQMYPQLGRQRPVLLVDDSSHKLGRAQRQGVTPESILDLYRQYGHEVSQ